MWYLLTGSTTRNVRSVSSRQAPLVIVSAYSRAQPVACAVNELIATPTACAVEFSENVCPCELDTWVPIPYMTFSGCLSWRILWHIQRQLSPNWDIPAAWIWRPRCYLPHILVNFSGSSKGRSMWTGPWRLVLWYNKVPTRSMKWDNASGKVPAKRRIEVVDILSRSTWTSIRTFLHF